MSVDALTLKLMRTSLGLNQTDVARKVGISQSYLGMLERGARKLTQPMLRRLLDVYELNADGSMKQRTTEDDISTDELKRRMMKAQQPLTVVQQTFSDAITHMKE